MYGQSINVVLILLFHIHGCVFYHKLYIVYDWIVLYPLVYNSIPHPQWSSGYDFRLSLTPTSRGRPGFDSLLRRNSEMTSSLPSCLPALAHQRRPPFSSFWRFALSVERVVQWILLTLDDKGLGYEQQNLPIPKCR